MTESQEEPPSADPLDLLHVYEDEIIQCAELLDLILEENLHKSQYQIKKEDVIFGVESVLKSEVDSEESHPLAHALMYVISNNSHELIEDFKRIGFSEDAIRLFIRLSSKYNLESNVVAFREYQGRNYWSSVQTNTVFRGRSNVIGLDHIVTIGHREEVEITADMSSNLGLVNALLESHADAVDDHPEKTKDTIESSQINNIRENLDRIEQSLTTESEEE